MRALRLPQKYYAAALLLVSVHWVCRAVETVNSPPDIELAAIPIRDVARRGDDLQVLVQVTNKSATPIYQLRVSLTGPDFELRNPYPLNNLAAFGSESKLVTLKVLNSAAFSLERAVFVIEFAWGPADRPFHSSRFAAMNVQVVHDYEDEAKGLPGGSAALLYLILPIIPAFLAYDLAEGLRRGLGLRLPKFEASYLAPAFLLAILVEYLLVLGARRQAAFNVADPGHLLGVLAASTVAGAAVPLIRMIVSAVRLRNSYRESDNLASYLKKALEQFPQGNAQWVRGSEKWSDLSGLLLTLPDGKFALGARLQVSPASAIEADAARLKACFDEEDRLTDGTGLMKLVSAGIAKLSFLEQVTRAGSRRDQPVLARDLNGFTYENPETKPVVERVG